MWEMDAFTSSASFSLTLALMRGQPATGQPCPLSLRAILSSNALISPQRQRMNASKWAA